jgi:hypothetical protein
METLAHARDDRASALPAFLAVILAYVLVLAAMLGQVVQNENLARAQAHPPVVTQTCVPA